MRVGNLFIVSLHPDNESYKVTSIKKTNLDEPLRKLESIVSGQKYRSSVKIQ